MRSYTATLEGIFNGFAASSISGDKNMKTGIIDVGGGMRGIYAAGVFDYCLDNGIAFDYGIGISAGSANLASYLSGQKGRNYLFYHDYSTRKEYMGLGEFIHHHSFLNLDYIYGTLSNSDGENPLDYEKMASNPMEWYVAGTNAITGEAHYFDKNDIKPDDYSILKASSAIPVVCEPQYIDNVPYFDGALGNPVPVQKAFDDGCDRLVLVLTKPESLIQTPDNEKKLALMFKNKYPEAAHRLEQRAERYNEGVALAQKYAENGKAIIISPDDTCGVDTLTKSKSSLQRLYDKGFHDGEKISDFLSRTQV